jgi:SAM-dependent methyltransferase
MTTAMLAGVNIREKRVIDIGCGDGTFTIELFDRGQPKTMSGIDPSAKAVKTAQRKKGERPIEFVAKGAYELPWGADSFDIDALPPSKIDERVEEPATARNGVAPSGRLQAQLPGTFPNAITAGMQ